METNSTIIQPTKMTINLRRVALIALGVVAFLGIFSTPVDDSTTWWRDLILSKVIGFAAGYTLHRLFTRWEADDKILSSVFECDEIESW